MPRSWFYQQLSQSSIPPRLRSCLRPSINDRLHQLDLEVTGPFLVDLPAHPVTFLPLPLPLLPLPVLPLSLPRPGPRPRPLPLAVLLLVSHVPPSHPPNSCSMARKAAIRTLCASSLRKGRISSKASLPGRASGSTATAMLVTCPPCRRKQRSW